MSEVRFRGEERSADIRWAVYVRQIKPGLHLVKNECNDKEYRVSSAPGLTFKAGARVPLGSNTGHPGEFIAGAPPLGRAGASAFGEVAVRRVSVVGETAVPTPDPPPVITGNLLAFYGAAGTLECWRMDSDGSYIEDVGSVTPASITVTGIQLLQRIIHSSPLSGGGTPWLAWAPGAFGTAPRDYVAAWDIGNGTLYEKQVTIAGFTVTNAGCPFLPPGAEAGGILYFFATVNDGANKGRLCSWNLTTDQTAVVCTPPVGFEDVNSGSPAGPAFDGTNVYYYGHNTGGGMKLWVWPLAGSAATALGDATVSSNSNSSRGGPLYYIKQRGSGDSELVGQSSSAINAHAKCLANQSTPAEDLFTGSPHASQHLLYRALSDTWTPIAHCSVNKTLDTVGYYDTNSSQRFSLADPDADWTGSAVTPPTITIGPKGGNAPHFVHLLDYSHAW